MVFDHFQIVYLSSKILNMTAKFTNADRILEVERRGNEVSLFIYESGEEQVGQSISIPLAEINNLIKYLQSLQLLQ
jgi:hypothetical protein